MNILIYYPANKSSVPVETVAEHFVRQGHRVYFLSQEEQGEIHSSLKKAGVRVFNYTIKKNNFASYYLNHIKYLIRFTKQYKIDVVHSHLQQANLISSVAQKFSSSKFILCRHHSDVAFLYDNKKEKLADKIINQLGKFFIVPSKKVYTQMLKEGVERNKITLIPYAYEFSKYPLPVPEEVVRIRNENKAHLLLVTIARLVKDKRHLLLFNIVKKLIKEGLDLKLLVVGDGDERGNLQRYIDQNDLNDHIKLSGYKYNVIDYIDAADAVVHLSISEASNSAIKEAALRDKIVLLCKDVGDFDDYIQDGISGLVLEKDHPEERLEAELKKLYEGFYANLELGKRLHQNVLEIYSAENVLPMYDELHKNLNK